MNSSQPKSTQSTPSKRAGDDLTNAGQDNDSSHLGIPTTPTKRPKSSAAASQGFATPPYNTSAAFPNNKSDLPYIAGKPWGTSTGSSNPAPTIPETASKVDKLEQSSDVDGSVGSGGR